MEAPSLFGWMHMFLVVLYAGLALLCVRFALKLDHENKLKLLTYTGWLLIAAEVFKQFFLYYFVNDRVYDFWFIPFQLCSVPMYLCVLLPVLRGRAREAVLTFLMSYTFVSAAATFIYPEDILRPQIILTMHGFDWHAVLLFISLTIGLGGMADASLKGFKRATFLFLILCAAAVLINVSVETIPALNSLGRGYPNMFYLSPFHTSGQPVVASVERSLGRLPAMLLYIAAVIAASGFVDFLFYTYAENKQISATDP